MDRFLFISDLQIPFEAPFALRFCRAVQKEWRIPKENVYCVGDELDQYFGSMFDKDPDALHTPNSEIHESAARLRDWYGAFPLMKLAVSNHGIRWAKKAAKAGIPSQLLRSYRDIICAPDGWQWRDHWDINSKHPITMIHGLGYGGQMAYRTAPLDFGRSVVFGHLHSGAGIAKVNTAKQQLWGMNVGCLIDTGAYAFHYGKDARWKPWLGVGVVTNSGKMPILVPYGSL